MSKTLAALLFMIAIGTAFPTNAEPPRSSLGGWPERDLRVSACDSKTPSSLAPSVSNPLSLSGGKQTAGPLPLIKAGAFHQRLLIHIVARSPANVKQMRRAAQESRPSTIRKPIQPMIAWTGFPGRTN